MSEGARLWQQVALANDGVGYARRYAERFDALAAAGQDIHGEAHFVHALLGTSGHVLDAGCGTGRVAARLAGLGHRVVGVDGDPEMVEVARERHPDLRWEVADLAVLDLGLSFDVVVAAGNVVPFLAGAVLPGALARLAGHVVDGGLLVTGFGLEPEHLPPGVPQVPLTAYDEAAQQAGLVLVERLAGWDGTAYDGGGYAVSVHRRRETG